MIAYIKGKVTHKGDDHVVLETNDGVGYEVRVTTYTLGMLAYQREHQLFTHLVIKDDAHILYGFTQRSEKQCFLALLRVKTIGPGSAMALLAALKPETLHQAILQGDTVTISGVKGIGPKAAQRIIFELRSRMNAMFSPPDEGSNKVYEEALAALTKLGIPKSEASQALQRVQLHATEPLSLPELVRAVLEKR